MTLAPWRLRGGWASQLHCLLSFWRFSLPAETVVTRSSDLVGGDFATTSELATTFQGPLPQHLQSQTRDNLWRWALELQHFVSAGWESRSLTPARSAQAVCSAELQDCSMGGDFLRWEPAAGEKRGKKSEDPAAWAAA